MLYRKCGAALHGLRETTQYRYRPASAASSTISRRPMLSILGHAKTATATAHAANSQGSETRRSWVVLAYDASAGRSGSSSSRHRERPTDGSTCWFAVAVA